MSIPKKKLSYKTYRAMKKMRSKNSNRAKNLGKHTTLNKDLMVIYTKMHFKRKANFAKQN